MNKAYFEYRSLSDIVFGVRFNSAAIPSNHNQSVTNYNTGYIGTGPYFSQGFISKRGGLLRIRIKCNWRGKIMSGRGYGNDFLKGIYKRIYQFYFKENLMSPARVTSFKGDPPPPTSESRAWALSRIPTFKGTSSPSTVLGG